MPEPDQPTASPPGVAKGFLRDNLEVSHPLGADRDPAPAEVACRP